MWKPKGILTLDLASRLGFCKWNPGVLPDIGTYTLPTVANENYGKRSSAYRKWLVSMIKKNGIEVVVYEDNILVPKRDNVHKLKLLFSLTMITEEVCASLDIQCASVAISTWRKHYLGNGKYPSDEAKKLAMQKAINSGFTPQHHDAAEALGIMDHVADHFKIKRDWKNANFFGGR